MTKHHESLFRSDGYRFDDITIYKVGPEVSQYSIYFADHNAIRAGLYSIGINFFKYKCGF
jgi:hypothetical protein